MSRFELPLWRRLFRLPMPDPRDAAAIALALAGVLACWIPARRASQTDPMIAFRAE